MPIHEFECGSCGHRFEELVGEHVGAALEDTRCPRCGDAELKRLLAPHAPPQRALTPNQRRRLEQKRGIDQGGAKQRFKRRAAARRPPGRHGV